VRLHTIGFSTADFGKRRINIFEYTPDLRKSFSAFNESSHSNNTWTFCQPFDGVRGDERFNQRTNPTHWTKGGYWSVIVFPLWY
jgi:hypothetical protein